MKQLLFLILLFPLFSSAQAIEDERYGSYFTEDQSFYFYLSFYSDAEYDFMELTEEQKTACQFVFVFDFNGVSGTGYAVKKGNDYVSVPNEAVPALTFTLGSNEAGNTLIVKEKSGTITELYQIEVMPMGDYGYYDEEYSYDEEGDLGYTDREDSEELPPIVFGFSRSDAAQLLIFMEGEEIRFVVEIPEKKGCSQVSIQGQFVQSGEEPNAYTYSGEGYELKAKMIEKDGLSGWQFSCLSGTCYDSKKCKIWNEPFFMNY